MTQLLNLEIYQFIFVFLRIGSAILLMPGFAVSYVTERQRLTIALAITVVLVPFLSSFLPPAPACTLPYKEPKINTFPPATTFAPASTSPMTTKMLSYYPVSPAFTVFLQNFVIPSFGPNSSKGECFFGIIFGSVSINVTSVSHRASRTAG